MAIEPGPGLHIVHSSNLPNTAPRISNVRDANFDRPILGEAFVTSKLFTRVEIGPDGVCRLIPDKSGGVVEILDTLILRRVRAGIPVKRFGYLDVEDGMDPQKIKQALEEASKDGVSWNNINLPPDVFKLAHNGMANSVLWHTEHADHENGLHRLVRFEERFWPALQTHNFEYAMQTIDNTPEGWVIFPDDYQLKLFPLYARQRAGNKYLIVSHTHCAVGRPDIQLAALDQPHIWKSLYEGMLGTDIQTFQRTSHIKNFLAGVDRHLGEIQWEVTPQGVVINRDGHKTLLLLNPVGANTERLTAQAQSSETLERVRELMAKYGDVIIGLTIGRTDPIKGYRLTLQAIDYMLGEHPELIGDFQMIIAAAASRMENEEYKTEQQMLETEADALVFKHTQGRSDILPPVRIVGNMNQVERDAHFAVASFVDIGSVNDGFCLVVPESQINSYAIAERIPGVGGTVLVLSDKTGAADVYNDALKFNPHDIKQHAQQMYRASMMGPDERMELTKANVKVATRNNILRWDDKRREEIEKIRRLNDANTSVA